MLRKFARSAAEAATRGKKAVRRTIVELLPVSTDKDVMVPTHEGQQRLFRGIFSPPQLPSDQDTPPLDLITELASSQQNKRFC